MTRPARRRWLVGPAAALVVLAACGDADPAVGPPGGPSDEAASATGGTTSTGPWVYTDDRGVEVTLPDRPTRIVSYIGTAAVLWDFGVRPVGVFGPQRRADGSPEPAAGRVDLATVGSAGETWDGVNLEALAALRPDLVVTGGISDEDLWVITADQLDEVEAIAPVVAIKAYEGSATEILAGYERFVAAVGLDVDSPDVRRARDAFTDASDELAAAIAGKPGLRAIATYADADNLYIAKPEDFPDLLEIQRLGLDLVEPGGPDAYWQMLSWENAGRYPADLILHDERSYSLQPDALAEFPTWVALPAVRAGQVAPWNAETILSYQGLTEAFTRLAAAIREARTDVA